jgi:hypothetical protein
MSLLNQVPRYGTLKSRYIRFFKKLLIERIHILVLGFDDETELGYRHANDNPTSICKEQFSAQINKANRTRIVGMYGDNVKITAAGAPGVILSCMSTRQRSCGREWSSKRAHHAQNRHRRFQWSSQR